MNILKYLKYNRRYKEEFLCKECTRKHLKYIDCTNCIKINGTKCKNNFIGVVR